MNIFTALQSLASVGLSFLINMFPPADASVISGIETAVSSFRSVYTSINWVFPVGALFNVLTIILIVENSSFVYFILKKIVSTISLGRINI